MARISHDRDMIPWPTWRPSRFWERYAKDRRIGELVARTGERDAFGAFSLAAEKVRERSKDLKGDLMAHSRELSFEFFSALAKQPGFGSREASRAVATLRDDPRVVLIFQQYLEGGRTIRGLLMALDREAETVRLARRHRQIGRKSSRKARAG